MMKSKWMWVGLIVIALVVLAGTGVIPMPTGSKYQAVFLSNNQVYFGRLREASRGYVKLENIFYLRVNQGLQQGSQTGTDISLVKLGSEIHGPEDMMFIPKQQIVFWENLQDGSEVVKSIGDFFKQNPQ